MLVGRLLPRGYQSQIIVTSGVLEYYACGWAGASPAVTIYWGVLSTVFVQLGQRKPMTIIITIGLSPSLLVSTGLFCQSNTTTELTSFAGNAIPVFKIAATGPGTTAMKLRKIDA